MDGLPTGSTQSWFIVAAVGLSPMIVFFIAEVISQFLRHKWRECQPGSGPVRSEEGERRQRRVDAPLG